MKKADIKTGVVYAYQGRTYGDPDPAVLVSTDLWTGRDRYERGRDSAPWCQPAGDRKPGRDYLGRATGYVVVLPAGSKPGETPEQLHARMLAITPADLEATRDGQAGDGLYFAILTRLTPLAGLYGEVMAEREQRRQRDSELAAERAAEESREASRRADLIARCAALGVKVTRDYRESGLLSLTLDEAAKIAEMLEAGR